MVGWSWFVLVLGGLFGIGHGATRDDIVRTFSLSKQDLGNDVKCPQTVVHTGYESSGRNGGYLRIAHGSIRVNGAACTNASYTALLDADTFDFEYRRNLDLFPTAPRVDRGLLQLLTLGRSLIGVEAFEDLRCGSFTFRKGTMVAFVRNNTAPLAPLGLSDVDKNETYLLMFESGVTNAKRCVYRAGEQSDNSPVCFPGHAQVTLHDGTTMRMDALQHGALVRTARGHSPVYAFSHSDSTRMERYIRLDTARGALTVSALHYVFSRGAMRPAHTVRVGDILDMTDGNAVVTSIEHSVLRTGVFNPHTLASELYVDGFRVSSYTQAVHPHLAHQLLAPVRLLWRLTGGWHHSTSPLRMLHSNLRLRTLLRFFPRGPEQLEW